MRYALAIFLLIASSAQAATLSIVSPSTTTAPNSLVLITKFPTTNVPVAWWVRDAHWQGESGLPEDGWFAIGYRNIAPSGQSEWVTRSNIVVPADGSPNIELLAATRGLDHLHLDLSPFIAAGDANVQIILPNYSGPYETITFVSPHLGTVVMTPEPTALWLILGAAGCLVRRRQALGR